MKKAYFLALLMPLVFFGSGAYSAHAIVEATSNDYVNTDPSNGSTEFGNAPVQELGGGGVVTVAASQNSTSNTSSGLSACSTLAANGLSGVVGCVTGIIDSITLLIVAASVVWIIWGAFNMIYKEEKRESGRQTIVYGIIGLFVMISIWGFVNILNTTFKLNSDYIKAPTYHP